MPDDAPREDYGARIRAAQAYAGLEATPFVEALGFSKRTLDRLYRNERAPNIPEVKRIAEVCRVPVGFLVEGWNVARPIQDRLTDTERRLAAIEGQLGALLGAASVDPAAQGDIADRIVKTVERALDRRSPEVARPRQRPAAASGQ